MSLLFLGTSQNRIIRIWEAGDLELGRHTYCWFQSDSESGNKNFSNILKIIWMKVLLKCSLHQIDSHSTIEYIPKFIDPPAKLSRIILKIALGRLKNDRGQTCR